MTRITQRDLLRTVAARWALQYHGAGMPKQQAITKALAALDGETVTAATVNTLIGNDSWTMLQCEECERMVAAVVEVGPTVPYEQSPVRLCKDCVAQAWNLLTAQPAEQEQAS